MRVAINWYKTVSGWVREQYEKLNRQNLSEQEILQLKLINSNSSGTETRKRKYLPGHKCFNSVKNMNLFISHQVDRIAKEKSYVKRSKLIWKLANTSNAVTMYSVYKILGSSYFRVTTPREFQLMWSSIKLKKPWRAEIIRRIYIPKKNGSKRPLGIPKIKERLRTKNINTLVQEIYEEKMKKVEQYGFLEGRSIIRAVNSIWLKLEQERGRGRWRRIWVHDIDIEKFFDSINHKKLMEVIKLWAGNEKSSLNKYLRSLLKATYIEEIEGKWRKLGNKQGTPQGSVLSPWLANWYSWSGGLQSVIKGCEEENWSMSFADDGIIIGNEGHLEEYEKKLANLDLRMNSEKLKTIKKGNEEIKTFKFLGIEIDAVRSEATIKGRKFKFPLEEQAIGRWITENSKKPKKYEQVRKENSLECLGMKSLGIKSGTSNRNRSVGIWMGIRSMNTWTGRKGWKRRVGSKEIRKHLREAVEYEKLNEKLTRTWGKRAAWVLRIAYNRYNWNLSEERKTLSEDWFWEGYMKGEYSA